jgi:hypothetical protein
MKKLFVLAALLLVQSQAFAGYGECRNLKLTCSALYITLNDTVEKGPSASDTLSDTQPEDLAPVECVASLQLNTEAGHFVGFYHDGSKTLTASLHPTEGWNRIQASGRLTSEDDFMLNLEPKGRSNYKTVFFSCSLQQK